MHDGNRSGFPPVKTFLRHNYRHFNSAVLVDAAEAYADHIRGGGKMMLALAGAMSTAELGITLAAMIRGGKVDAVSCTGANLEEDLFNLVAHEQYRRVPHYRDLKPEEELALFRDKMSRVTDTCIPEEEAMRKVEGVVFDFWKKAQDEGRRCFPPEFILDVIRSRALAHHYQIDETDSWLVAACEKGIPIFVPGWEDSTLGNFFVSCVRGGRLKDYATVKSGLETMEALVDWYLAESASGEMGFFQIGGGIAGDFAICVVPLIRQDLRMDCRLWSYFCQVSDSTTSYGSYSGAVPNEKITWGKLGVDSRRYIIESDATIVAPLVFAYVLAG